MFMHQVPDAVTSNEENAGERTKDNKTTYDVFIQARLVHKH